MTHHDIGIVFSHGIQMSVVNTECKGSQGVWMGQGWVPQRRRSKRKPVLVRASKGGVTDIQAMGNTHSRSLLMGDNVTKSMLKHGFNLESQIFLAY